MLVSMRWIELEGEGENWVSGDERVFIALVEKKEGYFKWGWFWNILF